MRKSLVVREVFSWGLYGVGENPLDAYQQILAQNGSFGFGLFGLGQIVEQRVFDRGEPHNVKK